MEYKAIKRLLIRIVQPIIRARLRNKLFFLMLCMLAFADVRRHAAIYRVIRPVRPLDEPFSTRCQEPQVDAPRENAAIVMLARNKDVEGALWTVTNLEKSFNRWFHYPIVFLNNEPWSPQFIETMTAAASGDVKFGVIDRSMWDWPSWIDRGKARAGMESRKRAGVLYSGVGNTSYHHMCRFNSGYC